VKKLAADRPYADPEAAAKRILEIANSIEPAMKGRIYIELVNGPFLFRDGGSVAEYLARAEQRFMELTGRSDSTSGSPARKSAASFSVSAWRPSGSINQDTERPI
jgi:hypothetical protein